MNAPPLFNLRQGGSRLIVSIPHAGTFVPEPVATRLTDVGRAVVDTDWHVEKLYGFLEELDVTVLVATHSRIVADLNRPPSGAKLYPGMTETGLCPTESFAGEALYAFDPPDAMELSQRLELYWRPYHMALQAQIARVQALHGEARLLDAHSIRAEVPRLFEGKLPDLNFGTYDGAACEAFLATRACAASGNEFTQVLNGRFKGGFITRHYGSPVDRVNALQLEMAQGTYMDESAPDVYDPQRAASLIAVLRRVVGALIIA